MALLTEPKMRRANTALTTATGGASLLFCQEKMLPVMRAVPAARK